MNSTTTATSITSASITDTYLLAEIECAVLRAKLLENDLRAIGLALKGHLIDADAAVEYLWHCDALRLVAPSSSPTWAST